MTSWRVKVEGTEGKTIEQEEGSCCCCCCTARCDRRPACVADQLNGMCDAAVFDRAIAIVGRSPH